jgi:hypothetical protein
LYTLANLEIDVIHKIFIYNAKVTQPLVAFYEEKIRKWDSDRKKFRWLNGRSMPYHDHLKENMPKKEEGLGKLVATTARTPSNIYVLNEIGKETFFLGKEDEVWIWHKRMGHINFDNIVKVSKKETVREIPQISKPTNILCKHFLQGKKTKTKFKIKEYSSINPLEIVHTDLVGPIRTK